VNKVATLNEIEASDTLIFHYNPDYHELAVWNLFAFLISQGCFAVTKIVGKATKAVEIKHNFEKVEALTACV
jgi:hypothetical protein